MPPTRVANVRSDVWGSQGLGTSLTTTSDDWNQWPGRQVRVSVSIDQDEDVSATLRDIAEVLEPIVLRTSVSSRAAVGMTNMRVSASDFAHFETDRRPNWKSRPAGLPAELIANDERAEPLHQRLAHELRLMTKLPASSLASALGVTREQYQRWLRGSPISRIRHGQLIYLHTIAAEVSRKLGEEQGPLWWRTPDTNGVTPENRLQSRMVDEVHKLVASITDEAPIHEGVWVALPHQEPLLTEEDPHDPDESPLPWSPYPDQPDGDR